MEKLIQYKEMREAIVKVRELHFYCDDCFGCHECKEKEYPCETIKALNGEQ